MGAVVAKPIVKLFKNKQSPAQTTYSAPTKAEV